MTEEVNSSLLRQKLLFHKKEKYVVNPTRAIRTVHPGFSFDRICGSSERT